MNNMTPGKAVEIGSDGNVYFADTNLAAAILMTFLHKKIGIKLWSGIVKEVSNEWIKIRVYLSPSTKPAIVMQYDISKVVIVTEVFEESR